MGIIVYTAVYGDFERTIKTPTIVTPGVRYICCTDSMLEYNPRVWRVYHRPRKWDDPRRQARQWKCLPHRLLPQHDYSIWVDANLQLNVSPIELIKLLGDRDLVSFKHPDRGSEMEEAEHIAGIPELDIPTTVLSQACRHRENGFPDTLGLLETAIVVRRNNARVAGFNELWWDEICRGSRRDQVSVMYCLWKTNLHFGCLPGDKGRNNTPFAVCASHGN